MRNWFRRFWNRSREQRPSRLPSFRPTLEILEERSLLDAGMSMMMPSTMTMPTTMMPSTMMMPSNGMGQLSNNVMMEAQVDAFFQMLDARLISVESAIVARMPQLEGMIQSFNAMVTGEESVIAGHPINDLSGKV
jgi:hypothetical protein